MEIKSSFLMCMSFLTISASALGADLKAIQPGDMTILFEGVETSARLARLMTLKDLGFTNRDMKAIRIHAKRTLKIEKEFDFDNGAMYESAKNRDTDLVDEACFKAIENWKVTAVRIAPFEYALPGSKSILDNYAKAKNLETLDRVFQVRFTLNPVCDQPEMKVLDAGLHVIFNVWPDDRRLRDAILKPLQAYLQTNSQNDLEKHLRAFFSPQYKTFYDGLMEKFGKLATARSRTAANSKALTNLYQSAAVSPIYFLTSFEEGDAVHSPPAEDRASPPLKWRGSDRFENEDYFDALKTFTKTISKRENLVRVALNFLEGSDSWTLLGLLAVSEPQANIFVPEDTMQAKTVFRSLFPQELQTFQAVISSTQKLYIKQVTTSGYYASLDLASRSDQANGIRGVEIFKPKLFAAVDFYQSEKSGQAVLTPKPAPGEKFPLSKLLNNPRLSNASTTSCVTCHVLPVIGGIKSPGGPYEQIASAFSLEPEQNVRMMGFGRHQGEPTIRSMTVNEVALDMKKLDAYIKSLKSL